ADLGAIKASFEHFPHAVEDRVHRFGTDMGDALALAYIHEARGNSNIRHRQLRAAEDQRFLRQPVADALRSDGTRLEIHEAAAAKGNGTDVGHAEERTDAANFDDAVRLPGESLVEAAEIRSGSADVRDDSVLDPRQICRAAHRI